MIRAVKDQTVPEQLPPPWLEGPAAPRQVPASSPPASKRWTKGMPSPNKAGRPKGIVDRRAKLGERMLANADGILSVMVGKALDGDASAAHLILARVLPALRSQAEKVQFPFDPSTPIPEQIEAVLAAIASGLIAPDVGQTVVSAIGTLSDARAVADLEARVITLEAKSVEIR